MQKHTLQGLTRRERAVFRALFGYSRHMPFYFGTHFNRTGHAERPQHTTEYLVRRFIHNGLLVVRDDRGMPVRRISTSSRTPYDFTPTSRGRQIATHLFAGK